ncbi:Chemotaxis protein CheA [BD1-7 clade bacterium]|uniref:Chemotaxis protein CheA n=1 Tax=BD1-7 clade bacterium TaxID=2029982 RepID=A0A5S9QGQ7_9GAMM|nr:Chemotaxis protein CheA [BD1-7 clade bacterium]
MADLLDKLWPAFVSEITDQLDSIELLLARASDASAIDIDHLFRNFHTIKGNCSMIGFTSMEQVAHFSEDILSAVRAGDISMSDDVVDMLLESIDRLKKQFHSAHETRENPPQDDALIEKLQGFVETRLSDSAVAASGASRTDLLGTFTTAAKTAVPSVILGLDPNAKPALVEAAIRQLADPARELDFKALPKSLNHFIATLHSEIDDKASQLLLVAAEIFEDLEFIAAEEGIDLGLETGARLCRAKLAAPNAEQLAQLHRLLAELADKPEADWQADTFVELVNTANRLSHYSQLQRYSALNANWRYAKQLVIETSRGYIRFGPSMISGLQAVVELAQQHAGEDDFDARCQQALETLQTSTAKQNNASDEILGIKAWIIEHSDLVEASLADLKLEILQQIRDRLEQDLRAVEIDIDFSNEEISEKVLMAVRNLGELMHSRTMFHDIVGGVAQRTSFCFMIMTQKPLADVRQVLGIIDKGHNTFTILADQHEASQSSDVVDAEDVASSVDDSAADEDGTITTVAAETTDLDVASDDLDDAAELVNETAMSLSWLRVEGAVVDRLISDVGELVTVYNRQSHRIMQEDFQVHLNALKGLRDNPAVAGALDYLEHLHDELRNTNETLNTQLNSLQTGALNLRVVPISYAFNRFHKFVRSTAKKLGKDVNFSVTGDHVKVDKGMIDRLSEPLAHMIRNAIDHGLESPEERQSLDKSKSGSVSLSAEQASDFVRVEVADDGRGLDRDGILAKSIEKGILQAGEEYTDERVFLSIFEPGFSTSETLTETSGRGVGMDVVKTRMAEVGGSVSVRSTPGEGTRVQLLIPVSAAMQSVILIENDGQTLAIPERFIEEVIHIKMDALQLIQGQTVTMVRDNIVPLYGLRRLISGRQQDLLATEELEVVIIANDQHTMGLVVDAAIGRAEVLVRETHASLKYMTGVSNAAILGDGSVVIILDCEGLFQLAVSNAQNLLAALPAGEIVTGD